MQSCNKKNYIHIWSWYLMSSTAYSDHPFYCFKFFYSFRRCQSLILFKSRTVLNDTHSLFTTCYGVIAYHHFSSVRIIGVLLLDFQFMLSVSTFKTIVFEVETDYNKRLFLENWFINSKSNVTQ